MFSLNYHLSDSTETREKKYVLKVLPNFKSDIITHRIRMYEIQRSIEVMQRLDRSRKVKLPDRDTSGLNKIQKRIKVLEEERHEVIKRLLDAIKAGYKSNIEDACSPDIVEVEIDLDECREEFKNQKELEREGEMY